MPKRRISGQGSRSTPSLIRPLEKERFSSWSSPLWHFPLPTNNKYYPRCISSVILLTFSVIVTTRQYVGNPIDCIHTNVRNQKMFSSRALDYLEVLVYLVNLFASIDFLRPLLKNSIIFLMKLSSLYCHKFLCFSAQNNLLFTFIIFPRSLQTVKSWKRKLFQIFR